LAKTTKGNQLKGNEKVQGKGEGDGAHLNLILRATAPGQLY